MSIKLSQEVKLRTLLLYRNILKLHYTKLNEEMRVFGDYFVKSEFTLNYKQADEKQMEMFTRQWQEYFQNLNKMKDIKSELKSDGLESLKTKMDIDQRKSIDDIKNLINNKV
jgi:hypothetical protein